MAAHQASPVPGILQARMLEWVAISFSNAWKWKVKVKSLSRVQLLATPWTAACQAPCPWDFPGKSTGVGHHCLLRLWWQQSTKTMTLSDLMERAHQKRIAEEDKAKAGSECFRISLGFPPVLNRNCCCWGGDSFGRATAQLNLCDTIVLLRT